MHKDYKDWHEEMKKSITINKIISEKSQLMKLLGLSLEDIKKINHAFPIRISKHYSMLIDWNNPDDPLMKMVMPNRGELEGVGSLDVSLERKFCPIRGLEHKFPQSVFVKVTDICASYCRYCFRRRHVGKPNTESIQNIETVIRYIHSHPEINSVLLTGGDPLVLETDRLDEILSALRKLPNVRTIRIGTRIPVYLPSRILSDPEIIDVLEKHSLPEKKIYIIGCINHPIELSAETIKAYNSLIKRGLKIFNYTVLLRGLNDDPKTLGHLFGKLCEIGVTPYCFFQCKPVRGTSYFQVPIEEGSMIFESAKRKLNEISKTARYIMATTTGEIEIISCTKRDHKNSLILKYVSSIRPENIGKTFEVIYEGKAYWIDDILKSKHSFHGDPEIYEFLTS